MALDPRTKPTPFSKFRPKTKAKVKRLNKNKKCPETEKPMNIGTYEVPTQLDLVQYTKRILMKFFNSYHEKTLYLLKDIKEATRATVEIEKRCHSGKAKISYRECVKQVSKKCVAITKDLVASLEKQKLEVTSLTQERICDMNSMRTDPIELIKNLATDEATMSFALPAFLRLLGGCSSYCFMDLPPDRRPRLRQLTDQDLVVRHFLTNKNYVQLIKETRSYV
ncbi:unnamed protein product [Chrysodeixis includens]|uniref:Uncharacterized protein n=1 Tax=Chrysodeixis includens TaxID=689277 RepID=A0A9N8L007_CHRIL|nr:unnamed protein product [Chrysodeixis includens]